MGGPPETRELIRLGAIGGQDPRCEVATAELPPNLCGKVFHRRPVAGIVHELREPPVVGTTYMGCKALRGRDAGGAAVLALALPRRARSKGVELGAQPGRGPQRVEEERALSGIEDRRQGNNVERVVQAEDRL